MELSPRAEQILCSIVKAYIDTGEPVASGVVSRLRHRQLSPATIRNVMAELAEQGYLSQPHTSAGRVPTAEAFRVFVHSLKGRRMIAGDFGRIRDSLYEVGSMEERIERSSHMLTEMTNGVGIAAAIPTSDRTLDRIELISLGERRVLMVVVTAGKMVHDHLVVLDEQVAQDDLDSIRNYLNANFSGWVIGDVQRELKRRLEQESAAYDRILRKLILLYDKGLLELGLAAEVHMEGAANLVAFDFHLTRERLHELFRALEQKKRILKLLERFLEKPAGELDVQIGLAEEHPSMTELALVGLSVRLAGGMNAKIAVLGPLRMNYERAMSAVMHVGEAFGSLPS